MDADFFLPTPPPFESSLATPNPNTGSFLPSVGLLTYFFDFLLLLPLLSLPALPSSQDFPALTKSVANRRRQAQEGGGARKKRASSLSLSLSLLLSRPDFCVFFSRSLPAPVSFESGEGRKRARKKDSLFLVSPEALPTYTLECKRYGLSVHIFVRDSLRRQR